MIIGYPNWRTARSGFFLNISDCSPSALPPMKPQKRGLHSASGCIARRKGKAGSRAGEARKLCCPSVQRWECALPHRSSGNQFLMGTASICLVARGLKMISNHGDKWGSEKHLCFFSYSNTTEVAPAFHS